MLATPHLLTGAVVGHTFRRPWLAWPVALLSHFLLDFVPHLDSAGLFPASSGHVTSAAAAVAVVDTVAGIALVVWLSRGHPQRGTVLGAACFALLPDALFNVPPWGPWLATWPGTQWLQAWHQASSQGVTAAEWPLGLGTQVAVTGLAVGGLASSRRTWPAAAARMAAPGRQS